MPNITHPSKTYKLTDDSSLASSNLNSYISNFFIGDIYKDIERNLRSRGDLVVNDINAIPTKYTTEGVEKSYDIVIEGIKESCKKLKEVFEQVIRDAALVSAAEKLQGQTYLASYTTTQIGYQDKLYMLTPGIEDVVYSVAQDSDDSFTFTILRKQVVSKLIALDTGWEHPVLTLDDNGMARADTLENQNYIEGKKPIYTFTDKTKVTFKWLDLDYIEEKMGEVEYPELGRLSIKKDVRGSAVGEFNCNQEKSLNKEGLDKMRILLNGLKGVEKIKDLTEYITTNCTAVEDYGESLKNKLAIGVGEFSLYFKKGDAAEFISQHESKQLREDEFIEFKFMKDDKGVVLPQFYLKDENPHKVPHLRMSGKGKLQMVFQDKIERETHFQIDDRFNAINDGLGFKKEGEKLVGLDLVARNPYYSEVAYIANKIYLIRKAREEHSEKNPLLLGDPDDQIKQQIEELLQYGIGPLMAKSEFQQDIAAINSLSESLDKVYNALGEEKNPELKAKVDEKNQLLKGYLSSKSGSGQTVEAKEGASSDDMKLVGVTYVPGENGDMRCYTEADHIQIIIWYIVQDGMNTTNHDAQKNQIEMLLEHRIEPLMAKDEFKKDMGAIGSLHEALDALLKKDVVSADSELKAKVDKIVGSLYRQYKQNEIKSGYEGEIEWYKGKTRLNLSGFIGFAAVAIVVPLFVVFPPAISVLAIIVPVVFGVLSLAALGRGLYCNKSVKKQKQYLEIYKKDIDPVKSTEFSSNIPNLQILLEYMGEVRKARADNRHVVKENQILIP